MERSHLLGDDLAWMPASVARARRLGRVAVWGGAAALLGGALVTAPAVLILWKAIVLAGAGATVAGHRAGEVLYRRQLGRMARGEIPLAQLAARDEGELVVVRGRIEAAAPLTGLLVDQAGVYRRLVWEPDGAWVSEAAVDFALVDAAGHRVLVQAAGARWLTSPREPWAYPRARFETSPSAQVRQLVARSTRPAVKAAERVLEVGAEVQVVGYKTAAPDVGGAVVDYRLPPQRATVRSGPDLPLVISRAADLDEPDRA
ncbi:MAG: hypothetical protein R3B06_11710 [Kofleriaceae bacterium]